MNKPRPADVPRHVLVHAPCVVMLVRVPDYGGHPLRAKPCQVCVAVRAESQGERWFCEAHSGRRSMTSSLFLSHTEPPLRGRPMFVTTGRLRGGLRGAPSRAGSPDVK